MSSSRINKANFLNFLLAVGAFGKINIQVVFAVRNVKEKLQVIFLAVSKLLHVEQTADDRLNACFFQHLAFNAVYQRFAFIKAAAG